MVSDALRLLKESRKTIALTGAGVSTESDIPDFRSRDGLWSRYDPMAEIEELGPLDGIISQNIDSLHQKAGSKRVVEFHGSFTSLPLSLTLLCFRYGLKGIGIEQQNSSVELSQRVVKHLGLAKQN